MGLKHTPDETSIMHPLFREDINEDFSDIDKEALRFLHDNRIPLKSDLESSNAIFQAQLEETHPGPRPFLVSNLAKRL